MHHRKEENLALPAERMELIHLILQRQVHHFGNISEETRTRKNIEIGIGRISDLDRQTEPLNMR